MSERTTPMSAMTPPEAGAEAVAYVRRTEGFEICVEVAFLGEVGNSPVPRYVWGYRVVIRNEGGKPARLVARHWDIVDAEGRHEIVDGEGVVGQTPRIVPGDSFEYHSGCPLRTPEGMMSGHYTMLGDDGDAFDISIPPFSLDRPDAERVLN